MPSATSLLFFIALQFLGGKGQTVYCDSPFECSNTTATTSGAQESIFGRGYKSNYGNGAIVDSAYRIQFRGAFSAQRASFIESGDSTRCYGDSSVSKVSNYFL